MRLVRRVAFTVLLLAVLLVPELAVVSVGAQTSSSETRSYVVMLHEDTNRAVMLYDLVQRYGVGLQVLFQYDNVFNGMALRLTDEQAARLASDQRVIGMSLDFAVTSSPQTLPTGISAVKATESAVANINGVDERVDVDVAVIDTGSGPHADLNIAGGVSCIGGNYNDGNGHGTHVAGTIGALDNEVGVVGVAPGARIWSVKALGANGSGAISAVICGIDWVTANKEVIEVANMSLGADYGAPPATDNCGNYDSDAFIEDPMHKAICNSVAAGVTYVVAAGNNGADTRNYAPARYPEVITVSALNAANMQFASFSNFGQAVDVVAPGVSVLSTTPGNGYQSWNGTSMATPHVAGAAALYKFANPGANPAQVRGALISTGNSGVWSGDRDSFKEPLIDVSTFDGGAGEPEPPPATIDAELVSISVPSSVTQGSAAAIAVTVKNNGSASANIPVNLSETPGGWTASQTATVAAGASVTVNFSWTTNTSTATGAHTISATTALANDGNVANNSKSATVNVQAQGGGNPSGMYVASVTFTARKSRSSWSLSGAVTIKQGSSNVRSATVTVRITGPNGYSKTLTRNTSSTGRASFSATTTKPGAYTLTVVNVTKSGATYTPALNKASSRSATAR